MLEKRRVSVTRIVTEENINISVSFLFTRKSEQKTEKAMLFDIATLNEAGLNLSYASSNISSIAFCFSKNDMKMKYYNGERNRYNSLLSELQRFGQCRGYEVVFNTIFLTY